MQIHTYKFVCFYTNLYIQFCILYYFVHTNLYVIPSKDGFTVGLCYQSSGLTNFYPKTTIEDGAGLSTDTLAVRGLEKQIPAGGTCALVEFKFWRNICICLYAL